MWWISFCSKLLFFFHRGTRKNGLMTVPSRSQNLLSRPVPRIFWNCRVLSRPALLLNFRVPSRPGTERVGTNSASRRSLLSTSFCFIARNSECLSRTRFTPIESLRRNNTAEGQWRISRTNQMLIYVLIAISRYIEWNTKLILFLKSKFDHFDFSFKRLLSP